MVRQVAQESARTLSMLMMIPADTIESVPVIRRFLSRSNTDEGRRMLRRFQKDSKLTTPGTDHLPICVTSNRGIIEYINKEAAQLFGYDPLDLFGKHVTLILPEPPGFNREDFLEYVNRCD